MIALIVLADSGANATAVVNPCANKPCLNNGTCYKSTLNATRYNCLCSNGYEGLNCELSPFKTLTTGNFEFLMLP